MRIILLKKYKYNYLLKGAVICFCLFLILFFILGAKPFIDESLKLKYSGSFKFFILSAVFIAPILEEITFRGFFLKSKIFKVIATIFLLLYLFSVPSFINILLGLLFLGLYYYFLFKKKNVKHCILFILNSFLFAVIHYNFQNFTNIAQVTPILIQFSIGFILLWLLLNFNLKHSIFFHATYNFIPVFILFLVLQFPENKRNMSSSQNISITWRQIPVFNQAESKIEYKELKTVGKNIRLGKVLFLYNINNKDFIETKPFAKYDIQIKFEITSKNNKESLLDILEKEGLILKK